MDTHYTFSSSHWSSLFCWSKFSTSQPSSCSGLSAKTTVFASKKSLGNCKECLSIAQVLWSIWQLSMRRDLRSGVTIAESKLPTKKVELKQPRNNMIRIVLFTYKYILKEYEQIYHHRLIIFSARNLNFTNSSNTFVASTLTLLISISFSLSSSKVGSRNFLLCFLSGQL